MLAIYYLIQPKNNQEQNFLDEILNSFSYVLDLR